MKLTKEIKSYLISMLRTETYIETIKPTIHAIYNDTLDYMIPPAYRQCRRTNETITDYTQLYKINKRDNPKVAKYLKKYYREVDKILTEKGFPGSQPGYCHLLESESLLRALTTLFVNACIKVLPDLGDYTHEKFYETLTYQKNYDSFVEINKKYFIPQIPRKEFHVSTPKAFQAAIKADKKRLGSDSVRRSSEYEPRSRNLIEIIHEYKTKGYLKTHIPNVAIKYYNLLRATKTYATIKYNGAPITITQLKEMN